MKDLIERLRAAGVHTLLAQFTDIHGVAKGKLLPLTHLDELLTHGAGFAGPSIAGTGLPRIGPRAEYYARGNASTATALPWMPGVARIVCDGFVNGQPFDACPRQVLKRARRAPGRARLAPAHRHRARVLPAAARRRPLAAGRRAGPPGQALLRPEVAVAAAGLPARAAVGAGPMRPGRAADRPRGRARPVRAELRLRRSRHQRRPPDAVQAGRAGHGRSAGHGLLDDAQALRRPAGQRHALPCVAVVGLEPEAPRQRAERVRAAPQRRQRRPRAQPVADGPALHRRRAGACRRADGAGGAHRQLLQAAARVPVAVGHQLGAGLRGAGPEQPHRRAAHAARPLRMARARRQRQPLPGHRRAHRRRAGRRGPQARSAARLHRGPVRAVAGAGAGTRHRAAAAIAGRGAGRAGGRRR